MIWKKINKAFIASAFLLLSFCAGKYSNIISDYANDYISSIELKYLLDQNESFVLIDLRAGMSYEKGHIKSAINIAHHDILSIQDENYRLLPIVIYSDNVSIQKNTLKTLKNLGYENVKMLRGGIWKWDFGLVMD